MSNPKIQFSFLLLLLTGTAVLAFFVLRPFFYALILAALFAVVFEPLYKKILTAIGQRQGIAALLTTIIIIVFILTPLFFLGLQLFKEAQQLYFFITQNEGKNIAVNIFKNIMDSVQKYFPGAKDFTVNFDQYFKQGLNWVLQNIGAIFSNLTKILINSFIFLVAFYYLLKDGQKLKKNITTLSPLSDVDNEIVFKKLKSAISSILKGNLLIALIQGIIASIGFIIFGIPNAFLWGTIAAISALIPGVGTSLVIVPAIIFLFLSHQIFAAVGLIIWGVTAVGLIDNFLGPRIVGRGMRLHPLIVILSVLGGVSFFGPIGFLLGPLIIALLLSFVEIYLSLENN